MKTRPEPRAVARQYVNSGAFARNTRAAYLSTLTCLFDDNPKLTLDQYTIRELTAFCISPAKGHRPAPNTVKRRRTCLRLFFEWCEWQGVLPNNPAGGLRHTVHAGSGGVRHHNWLSEAQVAELLRGCEDTPQGRRERLLLMFGFMMGFRATEIANVRWPMFSRGLDEIAFIGKGNKYATAGVPPQLIQGLQEWRQEAPQGAVALLPSFSYERWENHREPMWDRPIKYGAVKYVVEGAGARIDVPTLKPHDMRRSFIGICEAKGIPVVDIQRLARHSNVGTTSTYLEQNPARAVKLGQTFTMEL